MALASGPAFVRHSATDFAAAVRSASITSAGSLSLMATLFSRILCDARILNIFEGAAEIQAQVIARRLLDGSN